MTVAEKIFALWTADPTATALVPAARFKYSGPWQNITAPYVIFFPITVQQWRTHNDGASSIEYGPWQFSIYASRSSDCDAIRRKLIQVLDGNHSGFNFQYQAGRFVDETPDKTLVLWAVDFLATSA